MGAVSSCDSFNGPYTDEGVKAYAKDCGKDKAVQKIEEKLGISKEDAKRVMSGDLKLEDAIDAYLALNGIPVDTSSIIRKDGSVDWEKAAEAGGAGAAYAACSSYPATAPAAGLCASVGAKAGGALYRLADEAYKGWKTVLWGSSKEPSGYLVGTTDGEVLNLMAASYVAWGKEDYLFNLLMLRGVALQVHTIESSLTEAAKANGIGGASAYERLIEAGLDPVPGYEFLLSSGVEGGDSYDYTETQIVEAAVKVPPAPLGKMSFSATYQNGVIKERPAFDRWAIQHTNDTFSVRCVGYDLPRPGKKSGFVEDPQANPPPLFQKKIGAGGSSGQEANNVCYDDWTNVRARVFFDPELRAACLEGRGQAMFRKDRILSSLASASKIAMASVAADQKKAMLFKSVELSPGRKERPFPTLRALAIGSALIAISRLVKKKVLP